MSREMRSKPTNGGAGPAKRGIRACCWGVETDEEVLGPAEAGRGHASGG